MEVGPDDAGLTNFTRRLSKCIPHEYTSRRYDTPSSSLWILLTRQLSSRGINLTTQHSPFTPLYDPADGRGENICLVHCLPTTLQLERCDLSCSARLCNVIHKMSLLAAHASRQLEGCCSSVAVCCLTLVLFKPANLFFGHTTYVYTTNVKFRMFQRRSPIFFFSFCLQA
jgi:hypothetical protein